jgi:hypothetical protein
VVKGATQNWVRRPERIPISHWETNPLENIVVQKSHDDFYILISSLELQMTACLTTCSSFPCLEVLRVMCSNEFQIVLLCTNHPLVKPILNLAWGEYCEANKYAGRCKQIDTKGWGNLKHSIRYLMTTVATRMSGGRTTTCERVLYRNKAVIICKDKIIKKPSSGRILVPSPMN